MRTVGAFEMRHEIPEAALASIPGAMIHKSGITARRLSESKMRTSAALNVSKASMTSTVHAQTMAQAQRDYLDALDTGDTGEQRVADRVGDQHEPKHERARGCEQPNFANARSESKDDHAEVGFDGGAEPGGMEPQAVAENAADIHRSGISKTSP